METTNREGRDAKSEGTRRRHGCDWRPARRARRGFGQRSDEVERDNGEHGERAAADHLGTACGAIFVAMVQGAVYGAVNAVDRHGRPYLVNRSFPMASKDAAAGGRPSGARRRESVQEFAPRDVAWLAYDASLATIPDGALKENGIAVGTMAAKAMLAEGHDGRTPIGCTFGSGAAGVWEPLAGPPAHHCATRLRGLPTRCRS